MLEISLFYIYMQYLISTFEYILFDISNNIFLHDILGPVAAGIFGAANILKLEEYLLAWICSSR